MNVICAFWEKGHEFPEYPFVQGVHCKKCWTDGLRNFYLECVMHQDSEDSVIITITYLHSKGSEKGCDGENVKPGE